MAEGERLTFLTPAGGIAHGSRGVFDALYRERGYKIISPAEAKKLLAEAAAKEAAAETPAPAPKARAKASAKATG